MRVTVAVPTYNRPERLHEALESIARSTMPPGEYEVLVVNDGGSPVSRDVLPAGLEGDVLNVAHGGQGHALNAALMMAKGQYLTVAHDDDLVLPGKLLDLANALDTMDEKVSAAYGYPVYTDATGKERETPTESRTFMYLYPRLTWADIEQHSGLRVHGTATMYRTEALRDIGGWDAELETAEEYDLHLRLLRAGGAFVGVDTPVVTYRAGGKSEFYRKSNRRKATMDRIYSRLGWVR